MNKLIEDSKKEYEKIINKEQIEETSSIRNLIVKIFGTQYLDCFEVGLFSGQVGAKIKESDFCLFRVARFSEECFYIKSLTSLTKFSTNPITDLKSLYQNYYALSKSD